MATRDDSREIDPTCPTFFHSAAELIQDWKDVNE